MTSGKWWRGDSASDFEQFLRENLGTDLFGHRVPMCDGCGCQVFRLTVIDGAGARRSCVACGAAHAIFGGDAAFASAAGLPRVTCPCGKNQFEVAVGLSGRDGNLSAVVAQRCLGCGSLGIAASWPVEGSLPEKLLDGA